MPWRSIGKYVYALANGRYLGHYKHWNIEPLLEMIVKAYVRLGL